jgi:hypothetical protein
LEDFIEKALFSILGGAIAALIGMWVGNYKRRKDAIFEFHITLSELYGESLNNRDLLLFHRKTSERLRRAIYRIRPFIQPQKALIMDKLWTAYQKINHEALDPEHETEWFQDLFKQLGEPAPMQPSRLISTYLKKFSELAK